MLTTYRKLALKKNVEAVDLFLVDVLSVKIALHALENSTKAASKTSATAAPDPP